MTRQNKYPCGQHYHCPKCGRCCRYETPCDDQDHDTCEDQSYQRRCMLPKEAVTEIRAAINDELAAVAEYATLARKLQHDPVLQAWVTNIAGDEYGHARAFSMALAAAQCAEFMPMPKPSPKPCPKPKCSPKWDD